MRIRSILLLLFFIPMVSSGQSKNENTLNVKIDGEQFEAKPRKVHLGRYTYYTGNISKPETMVRIWLGNFVGGQTTESGTYLVIDADHPPTKKEIKAEELVEKYQGIAVIRYVRETKSPRMSYHVGDSGNKNETIRVTNTGDGFLEVEFDVELNGTHWKEKNAATVVGGFGRLQDKLESKVISSATGYDWNIDPEGNGYRKLKEIDVIKLSEGKMTIKLRDGE